MDCHFWFRGFVWHPFFIPSVDTISCQMNQYITLPKYFVLFVKDHWHPVCIQFFSDSSVSQTKFCECEICAKCRGCHVMVNHLFFLIFPLMACVKSLFICCSYSYVHFHVFYYKVVPADVYKRQRYDHYYVRYRFGFHRGA